MRRRVGILMLQVASQRLQVGSLIKTEIRNLNLEGKRVYVY